MPKPVAPHKSMPSLLPMGTLEDGLSPGMSWHPWGGPHLPDLESGMSTGMPWCLWGDPHFSPEPQPNPTRVVPMMEPGFQPPGLCPEHGRQGSGWERDLFYSRHWSHFLSLNFLLWPNSRLRTHNQGGLWNSPKAKNQPSITLSIWKIDTYTLIPRNASMPDGTPRERFVIQIGGLYYHTPPLIQSLYSTCRWHLDGPYPSP